MPVSRASDLDPAPPPESGGPEPPAEFRNVVVTGPASSGTRFVSRWLEQHPAVIARHWSMPSGDKWMRHWPTDHDFDGHQPDALVVVIRSFEATIRSQLARQLADSPLEAEASIVSALTRSFTWAVSHGVPVHPVLYDDLLVHPERFDQVFEWLGCEPVPPPFEIVDGNAKWFAPSEGAPDAVG